MKCQKILMLIKITFVVPIIIRFITFKNVSTIQYFKKQNTIFKHLPCFCKDSSTFTGNFFSSSLLLSTLLLSFTSTGLESELSFEDILLISQTLFILFFENCAINHSFEKHRRLIVMINQLETAKK